jgi:hypothetical protein
MNLRKVLIISPYFPPSNAADMQRVRMSLPYLSEFGWEAEIVTVAAEYSELPKDELLLKSIPSWIRIHKVKALEKRWTSKMGIGSLGFRSLLAYRKGVSKLLEQNNYDLIFFSTTQFPICALGPFWKKKFNVPYIIDMQDPWYTGSYYFAKPKREGPLKYRMVYTLHKYLERIAMKQVDGLISVSQSYLDDLKQTYPSLTDIAAEIITFGAFEQDFQVAEQYCGSFENLLDPENINLVYVGRGGTDMHAAISRLFAAFKKGLTPENQLFCRIKMYFIGTSYAPAGQSKQTVMPLAKMFGIENNVVEMTDRISYFHTLVTLKQSDAIFMPGSDDPKYTASKIYPYLLVNKPLLALFNPASPAIKVLKEYGVQHAFDFVSVTDDALLDFLRQLANRQGVTDDYNTEAITKYSARTMTDKQCSLFDRVIDKSL